jgi:S-formylglutathione hydrolase FrmB
MASFSGCLRSEELHQDTWVQVYFPDGRKPDDPPQRVIYLLHGTTGNSSNWGQFTRLPFYTNEYQVAFILPEIGNTWCRNLPDRGNYFNYIVDELPRQMNSIFHFSAQREDVAIAGNSSGAYAALKCAWQRPEQYGLCGGFSSGGLYLHEYLDQLRAQKPTEMENPHMRDVFGADLRCEENEELLTLARSVSRQAVKPAVYMTIGRDDFLFDVNERFQHDLSQLPLDFTYEVADGSHDWYFWDSALRRMLEKYYQR